MWYWFAGDRAILRQFPCSLFSFHVTSIVSSLMGNHRLAYTRWIVDLLTTRRLSWQLAELVRTHTASVEQTCCDSSRSISGASALRHVWRPFFDELVGYATWMSTAPSALALQAASPPTMPTPSSHREPSLPPLRTSPLRPKTFAAGPSAFGSNCSWPNASEIACRDISHFTHLYGMYASWNTCAARPEVAQESYSWVEVARLVHPYFRWKEGYSTGWLHNHSGNLKSRIPYGCW